ncbi:hypothetical protein [Paraburkholderia sp.]|uniref:hypothetical protein n=1 Tax=Paraburkholderia sp. TaxID=1926495 RepID=UPI0039E40382
MTKNTLNAVDYRNEVLKTESKPTELNFGPATLLMALNLAVNAATALDQVKRAIYYGRGIDQQKALQALQAVQGTAQALSFPIATGRYRDPRDVDFFTQNLTPEVAEQLSGANVDLRLLHAALGQFTESGEFIEGVLPSLLGQPVDKVNLLEEQGDSSWYGEIALDAIGYTREQCNFTNIKKLNDKKTGRYQKGAFDPNAAVNRDVVAERALLEEGALLEAA